MSFVSFGFWGLFLPIVFLLYICAHRSVSMQNVVLLIASLVFYSCYNEKYLIVLAAGVILTYFCGVVGDSSISTKGKKGALLFGVACNLMLLVVFKYTSFLASSVSPLLNHLNVAFVIPELILPVGLSFFVFQSCSYLLDVYYGKISADKNFVNVALFVSFFPTITSGPIQRGKTFLPQLQSKRHITFSRLQEALLTFLWGAFIKMVIADRLALFTNHVWNDLSEYSGVVLLACATAYSIQIYCDFLGYSYMAIAVAEMFGFDIHQNFQQPYFATSIADFWRRWHISLTSWFTDYLYIPLGGNRKGRVRRYVNIAIVFLVSGLWHGAAWNFIIWGGIHAIYQIVGHISRNFRLKFLQMLGINQERASYRIWKQLFIFGITSFAWIFFRASSIEQAIEFIQRIFADWNPWVLFDGSMNNMGLSAKEWNILFVAGTMLFATSWHREKGFGSKTIVQQNVFFKILLVVLFVVVLLVFGMYGEGYSASNFIYAGF